MPHEQGNRNRFALSGMEALVVILLLGAFGLIFALVHSPSSSPQIEHKPPQPWVVSINTAPARELEALPNVGEHVASRIIEYRKTVGKIINLDDLMIATGFSKKQAELIVPLVNFD